MGDADELTAIPVLPIFGLRRARAGRALRVFLPIARVIRIVAIKIENRTGAVAFARDRIL
jgi:hypothetical protein